MLQVGAGCAVLETGIARHHPQLAEARQVGDDVLGHAVGEIVLVIVAAEIGERQHGDRRPVALRQGIRRRFAGARQHLARSRRAPQRHAVRAYRRDEAHAAAMDGADQLLLRAVVADRRARRLDPAGDGGVGDDAAVPDMLDQIVLGQQPVRIAREVEQQLQHLGFEFARLAVATEREARHVDLAISEVNTLGFSRSRAAAASPRGALHALFEGKTQAK